MQRSTRTVARVALPRRVRITERQKVADLELDNADRQLFHLSITAWPLACDPGPRRGLKFSRARGWPTTGRRAPLPTSHQSQRTTRRLRCLHGCPDNVEVPATPATVTLHSEARRIRPKTPNCLPRTSTTVGPWLGGSKRTPIRESARSPPDHRGNRATRSARLPSGPRRPSKPAKEVRHVL
jgi:hypothetical protein